MNPPHIIKLGANKTANDAVNSIGDHITGGRMVSAITTLQIALATAEAGLRKIKKNPDSFPVASISQLSEDIRQHKKAISILSECLGCKMIADNPVWFYDKAICPACAERIRGLNHFELEK